MHLRRALLLFAIVLGLAAVAASLSRPRDEAERRSDSPAGRQRTPLLGARPPRLEPGTTLRFDASKPAKGRLPAGRATAVVVAVREPGLVEIPLLGLSAPATPLTPARFEVLERDEGRYPILFTPADGDESRSAGTLAVRSTGA